MPRTIQIEMTWATAAQIIAAALEDGTDKGRDAARAELFRMAAILDDLRTKQDTAPASVNLWEVIAEPRDRRRPAFGQTFTDEAQAGIYARTMRRAGYEADVSPVFATQPNAATALREAATYYEDHQLSEAQQ